MVYRASLGQRSSRGNVTKVAYRVEAASQPAAKAKPKNMADLAGLFRGLLLWPVIRFLRKAACCASSIRSFDWILTRIGSYVEVSPVIHTR